MSAETLTRRKRWGRSSGSTRRCERAAAGVLHADLAEWGVVLLVAAADHREAEPVFEALRGVLQRVAVAREPGELVVDGFGRHLAAADHGDVAGDLVGAHGEEVVVRLLGFVGDLSAVGDELRFECGELGVDLVEREGREHGRALRAGACGCAGGAGTVGGAWYWASEVMG